MSTQEYLTRLIYEAICSGEYTDPAEAALYLGDDSPRRAQIAYDILSKSINYSKLVRVERMASKNGKSYMTHVWVTPDNVKKGDVVIANKHVLEEWKAQHEESGKPEGDKPKKKNKLLGKNALMWSKIKSKTSGAAAPKAEEASKKPAKKTETKKPEPKKSEAKKPEPKKSEPAKKTETKKQDEPAAKKPETNKPAPDKQEAAVFTSGLCDPEIMHKVYESAGLETNDTLASEASFKSAVNGMSLLAKTGTSLESSGIPEVLKALVIQHNEALYGTNELAEAAAKYADTDAAKHYDPKIIASAVKAWQNGGHKAIRKQSAVHDPNDDPAANLYSKCLTDMIRHSDTVQTAALYRGIHVPQAYLKNALENGTIDTRGLVSTASDEAEARRYALAAEPGEVSVVLELPPSLKMKTLEIGNESLLSTSGKFSIKSISKDADGVWHVALKPRTEQLTGPVADKAVYDELNVQHADDAQTKPDMTHARYEEIMKAHGSDATNDHYAVAKKAIHDLYVKEGYATATAFLTEYARDKYSESYVNNKGKTWMDTFADTKTDYDPALLCMARRIWCANGYSEIRDMEDKVLTAQSTGDEICSKIMNDALNDLVRCDGTAQPCALYRGVHGYGQYVQELRASHTGDTVHLGAIASFSESLGTAKSFAGSDGVILQINKSSHTRCAYVEGLGEQEHVIREGSFRVVKKTQTKYGQKLVIEQI